MIVGGKTVVMLDLPHEQLTPLRLALCDVPVMLVSTRDDKTTAGMDTVNYRWDVPPPPPMGKPTRRSKRGQRRSQRR